MFHHSSEIFHLFMKRPKRTGNKGSRKRFRIIIDILIKVGRVTNDQRRTSKQPGFSKKSQNKT